MQATKQAELATADFGLTAQALPDAGRDRRLGIGDWGKAIFLCACLLLIPLTLSGRDLPPLVPPPMPPVLPSPAVRVLPNGLTVMVVERHTLPLVTLRLVVKAGAEADPSELPGTADLTATMLGQGTARRSAPEIAEAIDSMGAVIDTGAAWDSSFASLSVLTDYAELCFDLLSDIVIRPAFAPAEVERKRTQTLSALEVLRDDPSFIADAVYRRLIFSGTPYGHPENGTLESVRKITPGILREFHARHYLPSNSILAVVGDISTEDAFERARKFFGRWEGKREPSPQTASSFAAGPRQIVIIDKPDAVQTEIRIGNVGVGRGSPDYYVLTVTNQILGGPASNRLFRALRSQQGLTYSASSDLLYNRNTGSWVAKTFTRSPETVRSALMVLEQMERLRRQPISEQELETAKAYLVGHLALDFESSGDIASRYLELLTYDLPLDHWNHFAENVRAVSREDILAATRRFLDLKHNVIVLVGSASAFGQDLKKLGPLWVIPLNRLDLSRESLEQTPGAAEKR